MGKVSFGHCQFKKKNLANFGGLYRNDTTTLVATGDVSNTDHGRSSGAILSFAHSISTNSKIQIISLFNWLKFKFIYVENLTFLILFVF